MAKKIRKRKKLAHLQGRKTAVLLNGRLIGEVENPNDLLSKLSESRRSGSMAAGVNFYYNSRTDEFMVNSDSGRARRPYIIVEGGKSKLTSELDSQLKAGQMSWGKLVSMGVIEYLDAEEEEGARIALHEADITDEHTHLEIDPVTITGVTVSTLPYPEYNSSPRVTMACSMSKQSLGTYLLNFNQRNDSRGHILYYPQQPLVQSRPYKILGFGEHAAGQNFVVAVVCHEGYNTSDALVVNRSAIDRGLGRSVFFKTHETEERRYPGGQKDKFELPPVTAQGYRDERAYRHLSDDGIILPESKLEPKDVLVGKTSPPRFLEEVSVFGMVEEKKRDNSLSVKAGDHGAVDSVLITDSLAGNRLVKVRVRSIKVPEQGDKFASRHGQKGVIGMKLSQEDMPFTSEGIVPDLMINPHAIPSRMTAGHLLEMLGGKAVCHSGKFGDATAFAGDGEEKFRNELKTLGFDEYGVETLYDGYTGKPIKAKIYIGVIYYQKLHHLVSNKMHVRARGPVQLLTRQPTEGRAREGGLRFGEMERDCLIGYGASMLIRERLLEESDRSYQLVCAKTGSIGYKDYIRNRLVSPLDENSSELYYVEMSHAFKLLLDEIKSMGIFPRLLMRDKA
ncbi:DNA-directed RNA polymerase subunit B [Candidatus Micrarchaeota archaeon CG10_big_fil_rev_8_21_14_0_10_45_29]|nr:MAG: DNA-directed RNA polymerase subunit B [Candidatus Micrarchaeota archaeon CG10_big_fil_rev_8_21_14_0_10_45_29]